MSDAMEPEDWGNLSTLAKEFGEQAIGGLMVYSLKRASEAVKAMALDKMPGWPVRE